MQWAYLFTLTTFAVAYCYPALPCLTQDGYCTELQCAIKQPDDCINGHFKPNVSDCGCCPSCIKFLDRGQPCHQVEIPAEYECGADLVCSERTGTCVPPSAETPLVEEASKGSNQPNMPCMEAVKLHPKKPPACTPEGAYAPRQCRGEVCFCVTLDGRPIPYYKVIRKLADSMECNCARVEIARNNGRMCNKLGNFKPQ
ncbi:uncharacterized protein LOC110836558 isoform X2 [Zootermopsis nevadensis]|nr:uncharacterized protein LOC110836558 isoform X2 [Zootermopsis nevadensis]XP_021933560.1 uncharacterized protein LOC110836558 isoform X2 [Zootermopsis nevadensis]